MATRSENHFATHSHSTLYGKGKGKEMYIAEYSDRYDDYMALGKTKKEAVESIMATLKENAYNRDTLLEDFKSEEDFKDSEINVYKLSAGETVKRGYDIHYKNGKQI